ncbi:leucine-rich repeat domain-containing protein, partial [Candidatus Poribacteria bacterium]|nr:leucine-rich repeat domain-containing protein [Candidatus Poribacteria bacterium]
MELFIYAEPTRTSSLSQISRIANVVLLTLMTCAFFVIPHRAATAQTVHIPDRYLRSALKSVLGKEAGENITQADMASLKSFDAPAFRIRDISGLEFAINLTNLNLEFNHILDISPLENLTNLEVLDLDFVRRLSDISSLDISP